MIWTILAWYLAISIVWSTAWFTWAALEENKGQESAMILVLIAMLPWIWPLIIVDLILY